LDAAPGQARSFVRREGRSELQLVLLLPGALLRGDLRAQGVADLVAGGDRRDLLEHTVLPLLEEASTSLVDGGDDRLGDLHLFLLGRRHVVRICIVVQDSLEELVARVNGADPGLPAEDVVVGGGLDLEGRYPVAAYAGRVGTGALGLSASGCCGSTIGGWNRCLAVFVFVFVFTAADADADANAIFPGDVRRRNLLSFLNRVSIQVAIVDARIG